MGENTVKDIRNVGLRLFVEKGYEGTTMRDIARRVGIKASSIYTHYSSKENIFFDIMEYCIKIFSTHLYKTINRYEEEVNVDNLYQVFEERIQFFKAKKHVSAFLFRFLYFPGSKYEKEIMVRVKLQSKIYMKRWEKLHRNLQKDPNMIEMSLEDFFFFLHRAVMGVVLQAMEAGGKIEDERIKRIWELHLNGIKKQISQ